MLSAAYKKFKIGEIAVPVRYFPEASSINFRRSLKYGIETLLGLGKYILAKMGVYTSPIFP